MRLYFSVFSIICLLIGGCSAPETEPQAKRQILVSAASDLEHAFGEIGRDFERETGIHPVFNFSASGQLARQIEAGAQVDVFASANRAYVDDLERKGLIEAGTNTIYARGRIAIWTRRDSPLRLDELSDLTNPEIKLIAIANPDVAPYGMAAREALQSAGVWIPLQGKITFGTNVRETLKYAEVGGVDAAIVALSLSMRSDGRYSIIPESMHTPIDQALGVLKSSTRKDDARAFAEFATSVRSQAVLIKDGFEIPASPTTQP